MSKLHDSAQSQPHVQDQYPSTEPFNAETQAAQEHFWQTTLADVPQFLSLLSDTPRPALATLRTRTCLLPVSPSVQQAFVHLSEQMGVPFPITLLTAFEIFLVRYTHQKDFVIGVNNFKRYSNDTIHGTNDGTSILPLRVTVNTASTFLTLLAHTHASVNAVIQHANMPFAQIIQNLHSPDEHNFHPLVQVAFIWQRDTTIAENHPQISEFGLTSLDITVSWTVTASGLNSVWHFNPDLYDGATIERMQTHFMQLLQSIIATPTRSIFTLPVIGSEEWQLLIETRNATHIDYLQEPFVPEFIARYATHDPHALALADAGTTMTYATLNARANQLAHALVKRGVGMDVIVSVCLERSLDMIVALLGILKAGGAYLPIDPSYPAERRAVFVRDTKVLITSATLLVDVSLQGVEVIVPDAPELAQMPTTDLALPIIPEQLAYVIYTSGSTGQPKGVQITHGNLRNFTIWYQRAFAITASDRMSQLVGPGFDATMMEIWPCLTSGASLHIMDAEMRLDPVAIRDWLVDQQITMSMVPTVLAEQIVGLDWSTSTQLRFLLTGAEALHIFPPRHFPAAFINNYGPTETTVLVTSGQVLPTTVITSPPSIGRQIANTCLYLLDTYLQPVPVGVVGELYIGGTPVGRGYLNRPDLTADSFIPDPFSTIPGKRLYRTGDLCRYRANGEIDHIGRVDNQVKIRGYRIELGEIETIVKQQPQVRECVVLVYEPSTTEKHLVAYVTAATEVPLNSSILKESLRKKLPIYMVPTIFVVLDALPLTLNGKVNRRALPQPVIDRSEIYVAPRTPTEFLLAHIWADVLHLEQVGIQDDVFALGAHSLLATRIISRIRTAFQIDIPLRVLFEQPTIAQLAQYITQIQVQSVPFIEIGDIPHILRGDWYLADLLDHLDGLSDADARIFLTNESHRI